MPRQWKCALKVKVPLCSLLLKVWRALQSMPCLVACWNFLQSQLVNHWGRLHFSSQCHACFLSEMIIPSPRHPWKKNYIFTKLVCPSLPSPKFPNQSSKIDIVRAYPRFPMCLWDIIVLQGLIPLIIHIALRIYPFHH